MFQTNQQQSLSDAPRNNSCTGTGAAHIDILIKKTKQLICPITVSSRPSFVFSSASDVTVAIILYKILVA